MTFFFGSYHRWLSVQAFRIITHGVEWCNATIIRKVSWIGIRLSIMTMLLSAVPALAAALPCVVSPTAAGRLLLGVRRTAAPGVMCVIIHAHRGEKYSSTPIHSAPIAQAFPHYSTESFVVKTFFYHTEKCKYLKVIRENPIKSRTVFFLWGICHIFAKSDIFLSYSTSVLM